MRMCHRTNLIRELFGIHQTNAGLHFQTACSTDDEQTANTCIFDALAYAASGFDQFFLPDQAAVRMR